MPDYTTLGIQLISDSLPEDMRKPSYNLDKKGVHAIFQELYAKHPDKYKEVLNRLSDVGKSTAWTEGVTVSLAALNKGKARNKIIDNIRAKVHDIINDDSLTDEQRNAALQKFILPTIKSITDAVTADSAEMNSPYSVMIDSGARGSKSNLNSLAGADMLVTGATGEFLPIPVTHSYAEGMTPAEYFATSFGQRKGTLSTKLSTAQAGFMSKQLANATHRMVITQRDAAKHRLPVGLPTTTDDLDNMGAVLAYPAGPYAAGTILKANMLAELHDKGIADILIHSPITDYHEDGGISAEAAGERTKNGLSDTGDNIGLNSAQAIGERMSQGSLSAKHSSGVWDKVSRAGLAFIQKFISAPENFSEASPVVTDNGTITGITAAPQGGNYVHVGKKEYYISPDVDITVKAGDNVEEGDWLSNGLPHPVSLVKARGIGEARRVYTEEFQKVLANTGISPHRRNLETVVSGLLNWGRVTNLDGKGDNVYDDVVPIGSLLSNYKPRVDAQETDATSAHGQYLDEPVLHYTPGTKITKRVVRDLQKWKIPKIFTHKDPPDFEPEFVRSVYSIYHDPDWRTRISGFYTSSALEKALHKGLKSNPSGTSYMPALGIGTQFGQQLTTAGKYAQSVNSLASDSDDNKVDTADDFERDYYDIDE